MCSHLANFLGGKEERFRIRDGLVPTASMAAPQMLKVSITADTGVKQMWANTGEETGDSSKLKYCGN